MEDYFMVQWNLPRSDLCGLIFMHQKVAIQNNHEALLNYEMQLHAKQPVNN